MPGRRSVPVSLAAAAVAAALLIPGGGQPAGAGAGTGSIRLVASIEGMRPPSVGVRVRVECRAGRDVLLERTLRFGPHRRRVRIVRGVPAPARCRIEETGDSGALLVTYAVSGEITTDAPAVRVQPGETARVDVVASFPSSEAVGTIAVTKEVRGTAAVGANAVVEVRCRGQSPSTVTFPAEGGHDVVAVDVEPGGTRCRVRETRDAGADATIIRPRRGTVVLTVDEPTAEVTVTNVFG
jgi:FtsP/CotA-like multicopper oxidase with cupredoxin domain